MRDFLLIVEAAESDAKLITEKLPYGLKDLEPVMSRETLNYHHGKLATSYADRFNKGEGDPDFNLAGNYLHNLFFPQLQPPKSNNKPHGISLEIINKKYKSFSDFQDQIFKTAMTIQGSGWIYMSRSGEIKIIKNHQIKKDIALLIDWWEHAWALDYQSDKKSYLENIWRIINWDIVNTRL
jgi:Fe-Mn family superoxide dismutase